MEDLNRALIAKLGWEMIKQKESLWVKALAAKYCRGPNLLSAKESRGASWVWQSLLQVTDLIVAGFCWGVRSGAELNIWCDPWVLELPDFIPRLKWGTLVDRNINKVQDLISEASRSWKESVIRDIFEDDSASAILSISLPQVRQADVPRWTHNPQGMLTVKFAYLFDQRARFSDTGDLSFTEWKRIWQLKMQHRLRLLCWKLAANAHPLRGRMGHPSQPHDLETMGCPLCLAYEETREHLFLGCQFSITLWRTGPWPSDTTEFATQPFHIWLKFLLDPGSLPVNKRDE